LNRLIDDINVVGDRLKILYMEAVIWTCREKLERRRNDCHENIDSFFEKKSQMLNEIIHQEVDQQRQKLDEIHTK
ncbi:unnamed protein product, partial [Rotaria magnacalcarata]